MQNNLLCTYTSGFAYKYLEKKGIFDTFNPYLVSIEINIVQHVFNKN